VSQGKSKSGGALAVTLTGLAVLAVCGTLTASGLAHAQTAAGRLPDGPASQARLPVRNANVNVVSVVRSGGVDIISSHSVPAVPARVAPAATGDFDASPDDKPGSTQPAQRLRPHAPMNATLPTGDPGALADDVRGDHRLRANLLNADGTPNLQADNSAHQLVNDRRAQIQSDLKDTLKAFDNGKRNGASRHELNQLQARIRSDLDQIDILTRSQQSGAD
jgi:hypothetical protein